MCRFLVSMRLVVIALSSLWLSCSSAKGQFDCVETPGYCRPTEVCDSFTRRCEAKCTSHPPRTCPEGMSCDYVTGACRLWCKSEGRTSENVCFDGADDDCDGKTDCADPDCDRKYCGNGCVCGPETRREVLCGDGQDNDADGKIDCADTDCVGVSCRNAESACDIAELCQAGNDQCPANVWKTSTDVVCRKSAGPCDIEEKCDGLRPACPDDKFAAATTVCRPAASACDVPDYCMDGTGVCTADQPRKDGSDCGSGCVCQAGKASESNCQDEVDNDGDGESDCSDFDCPEGGVCLRQDAQLGHCQSNMTCQ